MVRRLWGGWGGDGEGGGGGGGDGWMGGGDGEINEGVSVEMGSEMKVQTSNNMVCYGERETSSQA